MSPARRRAAAALVAGLAATGSMVLAPAEAATPRATYQHDAFEATNHQRVKHDRVKVKRRDCVQRFAVRQARRMARQERMFHQDLRRVVRHCDLSMAGENVAYGYRTGRAVVNDGWMQSKSHRENLLDPRYRMVGIGARKGDDGRWYAAQVFGRR